MVYWKIKQLYKQNEIPQYYFPLQPTPSHPIPVVCRIIKMKCWFHFNVDSVPFSLPFLLGLEGRERFKKEVRIRSVLLKRKKKKKWKGKRGQSLVCCFMPQNVLAWHCWSVPPPALMDKLGASGRKCWVSHFEKIAAALHHSLSGHICMQRLFYFAFILK